MWSPLHSTAISHSKYNRKPGAVPAYCSAVLLAKIQENIPINIFKCYARLLFIFKLNDNKTILICFTICLLVKIILCNMFIQKLVLSFTILSKPKMAVFFGLRLLVPKCQSQICHFQLPMSNPKCAHIFSKYAS